MQRDEMSAGLRKLETGIPGFEYITRGGLPSGRMTLVAGSAGSAKTVFAAQFLAAGIMGPGQGGVFVTFEESPADIRRNMLGFGWDIAKWESEGKWAFVDTSPQPGAEWIVSGEYDLEALVARIEHAITKVSAQRLAIDSLGAIFAQFSDVALVRSEMLRTTRQIKAMAVTAILTAERVAGYRGISRYGVEDLVFDNVIILRTVQDRERRRRTIEVLKFRGMGHETGEFPFTLATDEGIAVIPPWQIKPWQESPNKRVTSGNPELDQMCGGGFFRGSIVLVSGATGNGKTLMVTEFIAGGVAKGEKCLLFAFEESRDQLFRNASGWGMDFEKMEEEGKLKVVCEYPEAAGLEYHLLRVRRVIDEFKPNRVAIDSLSALERVSTLKSFREFVIGLTSFIKDKEIAGLFTATTSALMGGTSITETHISTIMDSIILLRYVELFGEMRRGMTILKMRGSAHDKDIRDYTIDGNGMHIGKPFRGVSGILSGQPVHAGPSEIDRIQGLFTGGPGNPE